MKEKKFTFIKRKYGTDSYDSKAKSEAENIALDMTCDEDSEFSAASSGSGKRQSVKRRRRYNKDLNQKEEMNGAKVVKDHVSDNELGSFEDEEDSIALELGLSDSEDDVLSQLNNLGSKKKPKRKKPLGPLELHFKCEWKGCIFETVTSSEFHLHVSFHIPDLQIKTLGNGEEVYMCLWADCHFLSGGVKEIQRHVTFHSYHTKLKNIGTEVIKQRNVPKCTLDTEMRNMIPENIDPMVCEWMACNKEFNNVQVFFNHIQMHVNENVNEQGGKKEKIKCKWDGCKSRSQQMSRPALTNHIRTHTQEKVVGCPTCGHLFATNTKLIDHCERQMPSELAQYQCSQCYKHFPSLRLLKDHMRGHINFYKCCYCDMTCSSRHTISAHIRYKHLDSKPFKCNLCTYACKTQHDLKLHLTSHDPNPQFHCEIVGCEFACRTKRTLQRHMVDDHKVGDQLLYACHVPDCDHNYKRGCYLTKHLMTKHCLRWPSGHSKFMYCQEDDRFLRLRTIRFESKKLFAQKKSPALAPKSNFKVTPQPGEGARSFKVSSVDSETESIASQVFISIKDESGATINSCIAPESIGEKIPKNATIIACADD